MGRLAKGEQVGRSLLRRLGFQILDLKFDDQKERKVRTPQGSEPANSGACEDILKSEISF